MGTTLTGTTPQDTYDSLIKVTDNGPIGATPKLLSDGLGNDSSLALSTSFTSVRSGNQLRVYRTDNATYGSIQYLTGAGGFKFDDVNGDGYTFAQGGVTKMSLTSSNVLDLAQGQIKFPATQVASADPNTLDDYEEGTWTMGVSFGGASTGVTYALNLGTYTKIGRQVTVNGYVELSSKGSSTGDAVITGLPFTIANTTANFSAASLWLFNVTFANQFTALGVQNTTQISLREITEAGIQSNLTDADFANNSHVIVSLTYFV